MTQSHFTHIQPVRGDSLSSEESLQWMRTVEDRHNVAKHQAEDKLEELGALDQEEGPPSRAAVRTQFKRSEKTLQGTISATPPLKWEIA